MSFANRSVYDPAQKTGVNYFKHMSKVLMVPYGKAYGIMTDREILEKCNLWSSELAAVSELANSLYDNLSTVNAYEGKIYEKSAVTYLANKLVPLQRFNKKDRTVAQEPDEDDLKALMKTMSDNTLADMMKEFFAASGALSQMASQMLVIQTLLRHPDVWASKHWEMPEVAQFKDVCANCFCAFLLHT